MWRPCRIGDHRDATAGPEASRSSGAGTTWRDPGAKSPQPRMPLPGPGCGGSGVLHSSHPPQPYPGFLGRRAPDWPGLAARLISLSGDIETNPGPQLRLLQLNINGWRRHHPALERLLQEQKIDVSVLQETKLTAETPAPKVTGFSIHRQDRTIHRVGNRPNQVGPPQRGLAILVRRCLIHQVHPLPPSPPGAAIERLAVQVFNSPTEVLTITNLYRPPARAGADDQRDGGLHLNSWPSASGTIICADINGHGSWDPNHAADDIGDEVDDWAANNSMVVVNSGEPTRVADTGSGTATDITIVHGSWATRTTWRVGKTIGSDHLPLLIHLEVGPPGRCAPHKPRNNYKKAHWAEYKRKVTTSFTAGGGWSADNFPSVDRAAKEFANNILQASHGCIPRSSLPRPKRWWTPECAQAREAHHGAQDHLRANRNDPAAMEAARAAREAATTTYHKAKRESWRSYTSSLSTRSPSS